MCQNDSYLLLIEKSLTHWLWWAGGQCKQIAIQHISLIIEAKDDGGGEWWQLDYWSYKSCKAPVKSPPTNQHPVFYRPDPLPVAQPTVSKHWREKYHIPWTCLPQAHLGFFQLCLWPLIAPGYLGEGCHTCHQPSDANTSALKHFCNKKKFCYVCWRGQFWNSRNRPRPQP